MKIFLRQMKHRNWREGWGYGQTNAFVNKNYGGTTGGQTSGGGSLISLPDGSGTSAGTAIPGGLESKGKKYRSD